MMTSPVLRNLNHMSRTGSHTMSVRMSARSELIRVRSAIILLIPRGRNVREGNGGEKKVVRGVDKR